jgi:sodium-dependent dicarboxylate transporter 2/3/5
MIATPMPRSLLDLVQEQSPLGYKLQNGAATITESVSKILATELTPEQAAFKAKIMLAILFTAAFLWATEAIPLGATDLLVGSLLYLFFILPFDDISRAYMKDAVFFIFGILTIAVGVTKCGLDRRISLLFLSRIKTIRSFCFVFLPILAVLAGFLSEHALIAILVPVLMRIYRAICDYYGIKQDRALAVLLLLGISFAANQGGPGSPAAGGRNAVMVGYLREFGKPIGFLDWMKYALPYVIVVSLVIGAFMYLVLRRRIKIPRTARFSDFMKKEAEGVGKMTRQETLMLAILLVVLILWITSSNRFGLGGPCIFGLVLMLVFRIISWKDIQTHVRFDVVGLYAAACAMGVGLKATGAALWIARTIIGIFPPALQEGDFLVVTVSLFTGVLTNFMSDGATVAAVGPIALSMAGVARLHLWKIGLACAFSSSFANALIVGTPNNAIVYTGAVDPKTGEKAVTLKDFLVYGIPVTLIALVVLWFFAILGYWRVMPWR